MNDQNKVPHVPNNIPVVEGMLLPPHRTCTCPNNHVIQMSHQELLAEQAKILSGQKVPGCWQRNVWCEILYRGLASIRNISSSWTYEGLEKTYGIPLTKEQWNERMSMKDGYVLPEV